MVRVVILPVFMGLTPLVATGPTEIHTSSAVLMFMGLTPSSQTGPISSSV